MNSEQGFLDLFDIKTVENTGAKITATAAVNPQSEIYKAHFPGNPVTPGVTEIALTKKILQLAYPGKIFTFQFSKQIKFTEVLLPTVGEVMVVLTPDFEGEKVVIDAEINREQTVYLKAKLTYKVSE